MVQEGTLRAGAEAEFLVGVGRRQGVLLGQPPVRLALPSTPTHHGLVWAVHHALLDGRSLQLVLQQWEQLYRSLQAGRLLRSPSIAGPSFGVFSGELERALATAGKRGLSPYELGLEPKGFLESMESERVDTAGFVPLVRRAFVELPAVWVPTAEVTRPSRSDPARRGSSLLELPLAASLDERWLRPRVQRDEQASSCVVDLGGVGDEAPLFWVHPLGGGGIGGLFRYERLVPELAEPRRSLGIRAPEHPFDGIRPMAAFYVRQVQRIQPRGPYHLVGYGFGGVVAYEMAQQLVAAGEEVAFLGLIEAPAPVPKTAVFVSLWTLWAFLLNAWYWLRGFACWPGPKQRLWLRRQLTLLVRRITGRGGSTYELDDLFEQPDRAGEYRRYAEAHRDALLCYEPTPHPVRGTVFRVRGKSLTRFERDLGWGRLCGLGVDVEPIDGRHGDVFDVPHRHRLIEALRAALARVRLEQERRKVQLARLDVGPLVAAPCVPIESSRSTESSRRRSVAAGSHESLAG